MDSYLADLEHRPDWQFTAKQGNGELIVMMRGRVGAPFADEYYTMMGPGIPGYKCAAEFIQRQFDIGGFKLLRGSIPTHDNKFRNYTWKHEISIFSNRTLRFRQPLRTGMIFVDLLNGDVYRVHSIYPAREFDRSGKQMPEEVVHTFPLRSLSEEQLIALRKKNKFEVYDDLEPKTEFAILEELDEIVA